MPLLHRKTPFEPIAPPDKLSPEEEVFHIPLTNEIFRDYDDFFERTIQLNSMVWACSCTGKSNLTFEEALQSEAKARESLDEFPDYLEKPVLYLTTMCSRGRLDDLVNDIYLFMKDRYFVAEAVDVGVKPGRPKKKARIINVRYDGKETSLKPGEDAATNKPDMAYMNGDASGTEHDHNGPTTPLPNQQTQSPKTKKTGPKSLVAANPADFLYDVEVGGDEDEQQTQQDDELYDLHFSQIFRRKANGRAVSRQLLKLFLKNATELDSEDTKCLMVKRSLASEFDLGATSWTDVFNGPLPLLPNTPLSKAGPKPKTPKDADKQQHHEFTNGDAHATPKSKAAKKEKVDKPSSDKADAKSTTKGKKEKKISKKMQKQINEQKEVIQPLLKEARNWGVEMDFEPWEKPTRLFKDEEIGQLRAVVRKRKEEERSRRRDQKRLEREQYLEWKKPRDDLQCDDLTPLPVLPAVPLPSTVTPGMFGDCLRVIEFFSSFSDLLNTKEVLAESRLSFELLLAALTDSTVDSPLVDVFRILLAAKADRADEEDGDEADLDNRDEVPYECEVENRRYGKHIRKANLKHHHLRQVYGVSVRRLPVDAYTLTELIRQHIITAGYFPGQSIYRHRLLKRGAYKCWDDVLFTYHLSNPELLERMKTETVFDLSAAERLELLLLFVDQLITYWKYRERIDTRLDRLAALKKELRQYQLWETSQEKRATEARLLREHEAMYDEEHDSEEVKPPERKKPSKQTDKLVLYLKAMKSGSITAIRHNQTQQLLDHLFTEEVAFDEMELDDIEYARELQTEHVHEHTTKLTKQIYDVQAKCGLLLLGNDRAYRRYWYSETLACVLVEEESDAGQLGACEQTPVGKVPGRKDEDDMPLNTDYAAYVHGLRQSVFGCTALSDTCPVHGPTRRQRPVWCVLQDAQTLQTLHDALNARGHREGELKTAIAEMQQRLNDMLPKSVFATKKSEEPKADEVNGSANANADADVICEQTVATSSIDWRKLGVELVLDFEERVHAGGIAGDGLSHRAAWRQRVVELRAPDRVCINGQLIYSADECQQLSPCTRAAVALMQVVQLIQPRFFKEYFVPGRGDKEEEVEPNENEHSSQAGGSQPPAPQNGVSVSRNLLEWQRELLNCCSWSQLAVHLAAIERDIAWTKSKLQVRCRTCRRKGAADNMVLCAQCDRAYHIFCLLKPLKQLPDNAHNWLCVDCDLAHKTMLRQKQRAEEKRQRDEEKARRLKEKNEQQHTESADENDSLCEEDDGGAGECGVCAEAIGHVSDRVLCSQCAETFHRVCIPVRVTKQWACQSCAERTNNKSQSTVTSSGRVSKRRSVYDENDCSMDGPGHRKRSKANTATTSSSGRSTPSDAALNRRSDRHRNTANYRDSSSAASSESSDSEQSDFEAGGGRSGSSRRSVEQHSGRLATVDVMNKCRHLVDQAMRHDAAWPFLEPVNAKEVPDYYQVIKRPMDLRMIMNKIRQGVYDEAPHVKADLDLMFTNCKTYNLPEAEVYQAGEELQAYVNDFYDELFAPRSRTSSGRGRR